ncbi:MAG: acyl-protein synthetase [Myxococcales bacterium]|nr:acyl-protein synthetase [Myxococcales bacterium]
MNRRRELRERIARFIDAHGDGSRADPDRDAILEDIAEWQRGSIPAYGRLWNHDTSPGQPPAMPTDVFRFLRVAQHGPEEDLRRFETSGTTSGARGVHAFRDLDLYDRSARAAARLALFPSDERKDLLLLVPPEQTLPNSSLSYMVARFVEWFGADCRWAMAPDALDHRAATDCLRRAEREERPLAILGTSFAFVHLDEAMEGAVQLPPGSFIMQTGGFKGRSREISPTDMVALLGARFGLAPEDIATEYGMTELSSQLYASRWRGYPATLKTPAELWVPPWVRTTIVDPETGRPCPDGTEGILRIDDMANLDSVACIQTSDRAVRVEDRIRLLGRAEGAVPRGCSLAIDQALGGKA